MEKLAHTIQQRVAQYAFNNLECFAVDLQIVFCLSHNKNVFEMMNNKCVNSKRETPRQRPSTPRHYHKLLDENVAKK